MSTFLKLLKGDTAILVGGGQGFAGALRRRFSQVIVADPSRSLNRGPLRRRLAEGEIIYTSGRDASPDHLPIGCDLVLLAFFLANQEDPGASLLPWIRLLRDHGNMMLVEWYGGPGSKDEYEAALHDSLLSRLSQTAGFLRPSSREITKWLRSAGLVHVRQSVEDSRGLFTEEDCALLAGEGLSRLVQLGEGDSPLADALRTQPLVPAPLIVAHGLYKIERVPGPEPLPPESDQQAKVVDSADPLSLSGSGLVDLVAEVLGDNVDEPRQSARLLLSQFGATALASLRDPVALQDGAGLAPQAARRLVRALELGRRLFSSSSLNRVQILSPVDAYNYLKDEMADLKQEHFRGLFMDVKGFLVADEVITIGTLTSVPMHPREVFGPAIEHHCFSVLLAHNHPSGDPEPSIQDIHFSRGLAEAGRLLQIELIDHIIIGKDRFVSLKGEGYF